MPTQKKPTNKNMTPCSECEAPFGEKHFADCSQPVFPLEEAKKPENCTECDAPNGCDHSFGCTLAQIEVAAEPPFSKLLEAHKAAAIKEKLAEQPEVEPAAKTPVEKKKPTAVKEKAPAPVPAPAPDVDVKALVVTAVSAALARTAPKEDEFLKLAKDPTVPEDIRRDILNVKIEALKMNQEIKLADRLFRSGAFGRDVQNAEQAFVKVKAGREMGMDTIEAMNSLYIVNGKTTIWGAALSKKLRDHGWKIDYADKDDAQGNPDECVVTIKKGEEEFSFKATKKQIMRLGSNAFSKAPQEKLRWHALGRLVRFSVPEVLGNTVQYLKEEAEDIVDSPRIAATGRGVALEGDIVDEETITNQIKAKIQKAGDDTALGKIIDVELPPILGRLDESQKAILRMAVKEKKEEFKPASDEK